MGRGAMPSSPVLCVRAGEKENVIQICILRCSLCGCAAYRPKDSPDRDLRRGSLEHPPSRGTWRLYVYAAGLHAHASRGAARHAGDKSRVTYVSVSTTCRDAISAGLLEFCKRIRFPVK